MKLDQIIQNYIGQVPRIPSLGSEYTGEQLFEHFRNQAVSYDVEPFTNTRFTPVVDRNSEIQEQYDYLRSKTKEFSRLTQLLFEIKHKK